MRARQTLGEILSAFEFLDRASLEITLEQIPGVSDPLPATNCPFYLVVETSGSNGEHDYAKIEVSPCFPPFAFLPFYSVVETFGSTGEHDYAKIEVGPCFPPLHPFTLLPFYMVVETSGSTGEHDYANMDIN